MNPKPTVRFMGALIATSLKAALAYRASFWMALVFMLLNNIAFFCLWWIFFDRFDEIRGWTVDDMMALYGMVAGAFGTSIVFAGGVRELARTITDGELDAYLTQPKSSLLHVTGARSYAAGWGDLLTAPILLGCSGYLTPGTVPLVFVCVLSGAAIFTATAVMFHSLAFWLGPMESTARQLTEFLITFSVYPESIFGLGLRVLLYSLLPAGFIGFLPVRQLRSFDAVGFSLLLGAAVGYLLVAAAVYTRGLRRYESGNRVTMT